jgi:hypothetical protein
VCVRTPQWTSFQLYSDSESRAEAGTATQHTRWTDSRVRTNRTVSLDRAGNTKRAAFTHTAHDWGSCCAYLRTNPATRTLVPRESSRQLHIAMRQYQNDVT